MQEAIRLNGKLMTLSLKNQRKLLDHVTVLELLTDFRFDPQHSGKDFMRQAIVVLKGVCFHSYCM